MYIIPFFCMMRGLNGDLGALFVLWLSGYGFSPKVFHFSVSEEKRVGEFFMGGVGVMKVEFLLNFSIINEKISCVFPSVIGEFFLTLQSTKSWYRHFLALIRCV